MLDCPATTGHVTENISFGPVVQGKLGKFPCNTNRSFNKGDEKNSACSSFGPINRDIESHTSVLHNDQI